MIARVLKQLTGTPSFQRKFWHAVFSLLRRGVVYLFLKRKCFAEIWAEEAAIY